jgi:dihydrofolate reductase
MDSGQNKPLISVVAIISENRVLADTKLKTSHHIPWNLQADKDYFKSLTLRHPVIMGRATFETLKKPLANRTNIIVTRNPNYKSFGSVASYSLNEAIEWAKVTERDEIFIVGGGEIYAQALPLADRLYLTIVKTHSDGDIFFPDYSNFKTIIAQEDHSESGFEFSFLTLSK